MVVGPKWSVLIDTLALPEEILPFELLSNDISKVRFDILSILIIMLITLGEIAFFQILILLPIHVAEICWLSAVCLR